MSRRLPARYNRHIPYNPRLADEPASTTHAPVIAHPQRFHGFDALRGGAMLLGIVLHTAITYMDRRMDGLLWPLDDQPSSCGFDVLFWWIHGWRIPLFFVMAGFFAAMLARRRGPGGFIKHRVDRIIKPVVVASLTILPAMFYLWAWGWIEEGRATTQELIDVKFDDPAIQHHFIGPAHLWFLYYLAIYSVIYWVVLKLRGSKAGDEEPALPGWMRRAIHSPLRPLWFALPTFAFLAIDPGFYLGYHHVLPQSVQAAGYELAQYVYQGWFFIVGIYLFRMHRDMEVVKRHAWLYLALASVLFYGLWLLMINVFRVIDSPDPLGIGLRVGVAAAIALFCWLMIWGLTGLGLTVLSASRAWVRWLSDSAYWVYLVHLPIVAAMMVAMRSWPIGPWAKFAIIVAVTSALTLASYQWCVRYTIIGRWLNGPRSKHGDNK